MTDQQERIEELEGAQIVNRAAIRMQREKREAAEAEIARLTAERDALRAALADAVADEKENGRFMVCWWVEAAEAALNNSTPPQETAV